MLEFVNENDMSQKKVHAVCDLQLLFTSSTKTADNASLCWCLKAVYVGCEITASLQLGGVCEKAVLFSVFVCGRCLIVTLDCRNIDFWECVLSSARQKGNQSSCITHRGCNKQQTVHLCLSSLEKLLLYLLNEVWFKICPMFVGWISFKAFISLLLFKSGHCLH